MSSIHLTHSAGANLLNDAVMAEDLANHLEQCLLVGILGRTTGQVKHHWLANITGNAMTFILEFRMSYQPDSGSCV